VAFAFGGEADPRDYARALADAGLLALIASLGLAQFSHETTASGAQLGFTTLTFYGVAAGPQRRAFALLALALGLCGLALSGAPTLAVLFGLGAAGVLLLEAPPDADNLPRARHLDAGLTALATLVAAALATWLGLWRWRIEVAGQDPRVLGRLFLWFTWPLWPLALWTVWRWRRQLASRHIALPLWLVVLCVASAIFTGTDDRSLLLALPGLAVLAAFALPTLRRSVSALIDWFTLLFFSGCALIIWVIWVAMMTGVPAKPAANVAKLAPGFLPEFAFLPFLLGLLATLAWVWLVSWRVGRHRQALWKSLVLPSAGAILCWLLLMTLWLPLLDFGRSYGPLSRRIATLVPPGSCVMADGLNPGQITALRYHGRLTVVPSASPGETRCRVMVVSPASQPTLDQRVELTDWAYQAAVSRLTDSKETLLVYRRIGR